jgi:hypothetical protein
MYKSPRRKKIRNLILLLLLAVAITAAVIVELSSGIRSEIGESMMRRTAGQAEITLRDTLGRLFSPLQAHLAVIKRWGERGALDLGDHRALNDRFIPMMEQFPWATSMMIASETGVEYMLLRTDDTWTSRAADPEGNPGFVTWRSWANEDSLLAERVVEDDYDPRTRPWYTAAIEDRNRDERGICWTAPYQFRSTGEIGVTLAKEWYSPGDSSTVHVAGVDVPLESVLSFTDSLVAARNGYSFLLNRYLKIVADGNDTDTAGERDPTPFEAKALNAWKTAGSPLETPLSMTSGGERWWADFSAVSDDSTGLVIAIAVPETSFREDVRSLQRQVELIIGAILVLGMLLTLVGAQILPSRGRGAGPQLDNEQAVLEQIRHGEGDRLEFKSTLRWNVNAGKPGKEVEMSWLKTVVAYLNTSGGVLMVGVNDDGEVTGIEADRFPNADKFLLHYNNLFKQHIGVEFTRYVRADLVPVGDNHVFVIQCDRSDDPVYLKQGREERFYVRVGPSSRQLSTSEAVDWVRKNHA